MTSISFLEERRSDEKKFRPNDTRSSCEKDYSRIIHSAAFRRLQNKTQVLGLGENDFYRTRLTHSLEVAQIGAGIVSSMKKRQDAPEFFKNILPDDRQIQAICLAHDIGNPPFGHGGEIALNELMSKTGGFEGNGQTLRILSKLEKYSENFGLNPTRRTMLGVLKYPNKYSTLKNDDAYEKTYKPPKCYHDDEEDVVEWILNKFSERDKRNFIRFNTEKNKHNKTIFKSLDASIMELADDISYGVHDLEDAVVLKLINQDDWNDTVNESTIDNFNLREKIFSKNHYEIKDAVGFLVNFFIANTIIQNKDFESEILKYNVALSKRADSVLKKLKEIVSKKVINSQTVQLLENRGKIIIKEIFNTLSESPEKFLPESTRTKYDNEKNNKKRVICDYVSGMTDEYAIKIYQMMFLPKFGSIFDRL